VNGTTPSHQMLIPQIARLSRDGRALRYPCLADLSLKTSYSGGFRQHLLTPRLRVAVAELSRLRTACVPVFLAIFDATCSRYELVCMARKGSRGSYCISIRLFEGG